MDPDRYVVDVEQRLYGRCWLHRRVALARLADHSAFRRAALGDHLVARCRITKKISHSQPNRGIVTVDASEKFTIQQKRRTGVCDVYNMCLAGGPSSCPRRCIGPERWLHIPPHHANNSFYGFHLRNIFLDRFTFPWAKLSSSVELWPFQSGSLLDGFVVVLYSSICNVSAALIFAFGRGLLSLLNVVPFISPILSPLTHHFLRGPWTILLPFLHISLLFQSFFLSVMTLFALEFADMFFDTFVTQPVVVAPSTSNPSLTAVSGITSSDMFIKYIAYSELYQIATDQSPRGLADRSALFGDTKHLLSLWTKFFRESLLLLGQDYQIVLGRGKAPPPPAPPPQPPTTPNPSQIPGTPTHLIKKSIYKTDPNASTRSTSLGTSPTALAPDPNLVIRIRDSLQPNLTQTGSLWKLWSGAVRWSHAQVRGIGEGLYVRFVPLLVREAVGDFARWWRREGVHKTVEACFPRKEIDKLAIRALSHLVCAFVVEDQFGVVQRDIPQLDSS